jgi:hypothetical protein
MNRIPGRRLHAAAGVAAVALLCGCGTADQGAGARRGAVEYLARPLLTGDSSAELTFMAGVDVDSRGLVYIADVSEVVVFGPDGRVQRRVGREGDGPGEFRSFAALSILPGDSLFVYDTELRRATVFRPHSAEVAYTFRLGGEDYAFPSLLRPVGGTRTLVGLFRTAMGDPRGAETQRRDVVRVYNADGSLRRDSVLTLPEPERLEMDADQVHGFFFPRFARRELVDVGPDGRVYSAWSDAPRVEVYDVDGRPAGTFTARVDARPLPLTEGDLDSAATLMIQPPFTRGAIVQALRERWSTWPLLEGLLVDDRSRVWLKQRTGPAATTWMAFLQTGERVGSVSLPANVHPRLIRGDRVYAAVVDEVDVPTLVVYQLVPSSPAPREAT